MVAAEADPTDAAKSCKPAKLPRSPQYHPGACARLALPEASLDDPVWVERDPESC
jgi:hypothetical protein